MRTQQNGVEQGKNGKWSVKFISYKGVVGDEYVFSEVQSGFVFETEADAYAGSERALTLLETTGRYPNMCKYF